LFLPGPFASGSTRTNVQSSSTGEGDGRFCFLKQPHKENTMSARKARLKENGTSKPVGTNGDARTGSPEGLDSPLPPDPMTVPISYTLPEEEIARKAYALWEERGRPFGSAEEDWFRAKEQLNS
jgi:hypothetical protein